MRKKKGAPPSPPTIQVAFRLEVDADVRLETIAKGFGLDKSNFLRLVLTECLPVYEHRLEDVRAGRGMTMAVAGNGR